MSEPELTPEQLIELRDDLLRTDHEQAINRFVQDRIIKPAMEEVERQKAERAFRMGL